MTAPWEGLRDWSLITGRGGLQNGKIAGPKLFAPPPQDRVKLFAPPLLKSGNFTRPPPYNMAKTSSYHVKSTPKLFVPPASEWLKLFPPPPFRKGKTSRAPPPSRFVAPPLPVISDHSLIQTLTNDRDRDRSLITGRGGGVPSLATHIQKGGHMIVLQNEKLSLSLTFTKGKKTPCFSKTLT